MNAYELADQVEMWGEDLLALNMKGGIPVVEGAKLIRQQADRIAELEKQLDIHFKNGFEAGKLEGWKAHKYHSTPQTKPLSDEEIHELANQHLRTQDHDGAKVVTGLEDFARAIEERHGIK